MYLKVLVTGGSGFIGTALCRKLLAEGNEVFVLDTVEGDLKDVTYYLGDISEPYIIHSAIWEGIDVVYHLAAMANVDEVRTHRDKAFQINLRGTFNVSEACRENNILMIMASTACVYGNTPEHPSTEDGPTCPMDLYGVTKRVGEEIVKSLPRWIILRFGTTVGPEMRHALATWIFLNQAHNDKPFTITGNGQQTRNWIYVDDLVEGCYLALEKGRTNQIFNLAGSKSYTVKEMAEICFNVVHGNIHEIHFDLIPAREGDVFKEDISIEKARRMLGWKPKTSLKEALRKSYKGAFK